ncbi:hypothetical protein SA496_19590 [Pseudomonas sp. JS3066]|uniref:hypothetical protein n=1 Tax=unclassified Pseudomonas TaxID=196821 RepID=UPI000EA83D94|nr:MULTISPECIES: hypothetical protein [unclassified Pseudomonas]AYF90964.1 hypothetical protein D6Z43_26405 [Pseudomonas sp. DY-1]WVK91907.1 hypothetical protein SA496_19590 [Pseudomonas sp. JS3066]
MGSKKDKLVRLHERAPQRALEGLNRVTGLSFRHWPESLTPVVVQEEWESAELSLQENNRALPG